MTRTDVYELKRSSEASALLSTSASEPRLPHEVCTAVYKRVLRPLLFHVDAEALHDRVIRTAELASHSSVACRIAEHFRPATDKRLNLQIGAIRFSHPIGLAAGYDKNGRGVPLWSSFGFGHVEIGSISAHPAIGNPKPRLFRIPQDLGIVVGYGVPNQGAEVIADRLSTTRPRAPLGISIVSTNRGPHAKCGSAEEVLDDYILACRRLIPLCDYLNINLSCPNTWEGRTFFGNRQHLTSLLGRIGELNPSKPVFLKVAPFPTASDMETFLSTVEEFSFVTGFEINLPHGNPYSLRTSSEVLKHMNGAVSGKPCETLMNQTMVTLYRAMDRRRYRIIGAGGVFSAEDAYRKIRLGASLVQLLTAFIYEGPAVISRICKGLARLLERDGFQNVSEAVGIDA